MRQINIPLLIDSHASGVPLGNSLPAVAGPLVGRPRKGVLRITPQKNPRNTTARARERQGQATGGKAREDSDEERQCSATRDGTGPCEGQGRPRGQSEQRRAKGDRGGRGKHIRVLFFL